VQILDVISVRSAGVSLRLILELHWHIARFPCPNPPSSFYTHHKPENNQNKQNQRIGPEEAKDDREVFVKLRV
jgi:hypothetical protein